jgi:dihydroflavonol-4-reductase
VNVALTGASGFTAGRVLAALLERGHQVVALVRPRSLTPALVGSGARIVPGDLLDTSAVADLVQGADAVVHVAAVYRTAGHSDAYYHDVNVGGTERLLDAAAHAGVARFVHTSTVGVYGHVKHAPADEDSAMAPGDVYQETKAAADRLALSYHRSRGVPVTVVRPGAIYGPGDMRLLKIFRAIARGRYLQVGSGRACYHPVYIDDLVAGFGLALDRPEAVGEAFILAGPRYVSQNELAACIARQTGGRVLPLRIPAAPLRWAGALCEAVCIPLGLEPPLHRRRVEFFTNNRAFSIEKARRRLGYAPEVDLEEGVRRTAAWYRDAGWL